MSLPFSFTDAKQSSGFLFWKVSTLWQRGIRDLLEPLDLTHTQFVLLASLRWLNGASQADLSRHSGCDAMTVSAVVRTLATQGRVTREDSPEDRRAKVLRITDAGTALVDRAVPLVEDFDKKFFESRLESGAPAFLQALARLSSDS